MDIDARIDHLRLMKQRQEQRRLQEQIQDDEVETNRAPPVRLVAPIPLKGVKQTSAQQPEIQIITPAVQQAKLADERKRAAEQLEQVRQQSAKKARGEKALKRIQCHWCKVYGHKERDCPDKWAYYQNGQAYGVQQQQGWQKGVDEQEGEKVLPATSSPYNILRNHICHYQCLNYHKHCQLLRQFITWELLHQWLLWTQGLGDLQAKYCKLSCIPQQTAWQCWMRYTSSNSSSHLRPPVALRIRTCQIPWPTLPLPLTQGG